MNIAVLTSGILPVPAVKGGAVENLVDFYLEYNERHRLHHITVYSIADKAIRKQHAPREHDNTTPAATRYIYIETQSVMAKIKKRTLHLVNKSREYYHYHIEYYLNECLKDISRRDYDMIILENRPGYALRLSAITRAGLVLHLHNDLLNDNTGQAAGIYNSLSRIVCVSDYIAGRVGTIEDHGKTTTVHNGIDTTAFTPASTQESTAGRPAKTAGATSPATMRKHLSLSDDDFLLVFSGRITPEKGIAELIDAMLTLRNHPDIKLLIIGSSFYGNNTDDSQSPFVNLLRRKAEPLKHRILFTGFVPYSEMPAYLAIADVAVIPSVWNDPFPTTVLEAQAMGLPIITTTRGGIPEEVDTDNAIMLSPDNRFAERLADAILAARNHPQQLKAMGAASVRRAAMFTKERYAEEFFKAIEQTGRAADSPNRHQTAEQ